MTQYVTEENFGLYLSRYLRSAEVHHIKDGQVIKVDNSLEYKHYPEYQDWYSLPVVKTVNIKE